MRPLPLAAIPFVVIAAAAALWFIPAAVLVFAWHYPGIPALAATAALMAREAVNPSPLTRRLKELS
jgi:hypothetical protein